MTELEDEASLTDPDWPAVGSDALISRFIQIHNSAAVFVDNESGMIYIQNCHLPRKLMASYDRRYECRIDDLKGVQAFRWQGETLTIITPDGKAIIPQTSSNYELLKSTLSSLVSYTEPGFSVDHPLMSTAYMAGVLAGIFLGVWFNPANAANSILGLFTVIGAFAGALSCHLLVQFSDRRLKIGLAQPIGCGVFGGFCALGTHRIFLAQLGWDAGFPMILLGLLVGMSVGVYVEAKGRAPREPDPRLHPTTPTDVSS